MDESIKKYTGSVRVRVCGFLVEEGRVLLIKHKNLGSKGYIWSPPGGGVEFGEAAELTLIREYSEETGLEVSVEEFLFTNEYLDERLHAIELFFLVTRKGGTLKLGRDPELHENQQILEEVKWFSAEEINKLNHNNLHNVFRETHDPQKLRDLRGFFKFVNISVK